MCHFLIINFTRYFAIILLKKGTGYMQKILCPSMMCADYASLREEVVKLDLAGADIFHIDVMDGKFVPNFGMGLQDIEFIRKNTCKLVDAHLMIEDPVDYVELFSRIGVDIIYIHPEADKHPSRTLQKIKSLSKYAGIAINPGTSIETISELLNIADYVLVMAVNPGFAGQKFIDFVDRKIQRLVKLKEEYNYKLIVDGAISCEKVSTLSREGVDGFVLGTSSLFGKDKSYKEIMNYLRSI